MTIIISIASITEKKPKMISEIILIFACLFGSVVAYLWGYQNGKTEGYSDCFGVDKYGDDSSEI